MATAATRPAWPLTSTLAVLAQASSLNRFETAFVDLVDRGLTSPLLGFAAVGAALLVGALHALAPGHGKAIAAAYLVGGRGRPRDAVLLGVAVAAMHTASVLVLALGLQLVLRSTSDGLPPGLEQVTPGLRLLSGLVVVAVGGYLVLRQIRARRHERAPDDEHEHAHPIVSPFSRKGLIVLGMSGGLLPSPSAFLVLATTSFTGRLWFGLVLVAAFSVGLAATLTAIGLAVVRGRDAVMARAAAARVTPLLQRLALGGAVVVLLGGIVLTVAGIRGL